MKNDEFATPEILDVTAVEKARLHEKGETERKAIVEREQTTRLRMTERRTKWTDTGYLTTVGLVTIAFLAVTGGASMFHTCHKYPTVEKGPPVPPPPPCAESLQVVRAGDKQTVCNPGAWLETKSVGDRGDIELHCVCKK